MNPRYRPRHRQHGFSLLEAIVALTIMATCLLALYAWLSTSTFALGRVGANSRALQDARAAMAARLSKGIRLNKTSPSDLSQKRLEVPYSFAICSRNFGDNTRGI